MKYMSTSMDNGSHERYLFEYRFNGAEWGIEIKAANPTEAHERLKALAWAQYRGRIFATIPVTAGPLVRIVTCLRNVAGRLTPR
jgi:hypothetical protein